MTTSKSTQKHCVYAVTQSKLCWHHEEQGSLQGKEDTKTKQEGEGIPCEVQVETGGWRE